MTRNINRRDFLRYSAMGFGAAIVSVGLPGCDFYSDDPADPIDASFAHGVASGDPQTDRVIIWTRVTPETEGDVIVRWEVATDSDFTSLVTAGKTTTTADRDYTVKVDAAGLTAGTRYYYRFAVNGSLSPVGYTRTLPEGTLSQLTLALFSCSNYPAGHFHAYADMASRDDIDVALHVGDYIYEYERDGYASADAAAMGREVLPATELLSLSDYRTRYAQYHTDADLQAAHAKVPFITVWDDHEVANDTWRGGAENHSDDEGDFEVRRAAAFQAYFEWIPIRPASEGDNETIYRSFQFGDLVALHMLDTRQIARDEQVALSDYVDESGSVDTDGLLAALNDSSRTMMGAEQLTWLADQITTTTATWHVLGQQVLMGRMLLPGAVATSQMSITDYATLGALAQLAARAAASDPTLTSDELAYLAANADQLTDEVLALLQLPSIPYNLDAWDGYGYERDQVLAMARDAGVNLVVLSGDTHNAWGIQLTDSEGNNVGVEFGGTSVSSPGMEYYLGIDASAAPTYEAGVTSLVTDLRYCNLIDRGYTVVTFTPERATADYVFTSSVKTDGYSVQTDRAQQLYMLAGDPTLYGA